MKAVLSMDHRKIGPGQAHVMPSRRTHKSTGWELSRASRGPTITEVSAHHTVFKQGEPADAVFYLRSGTVKMTATSGYGKEAIVAILTSGEFFGEGCLAGQQVRVGTATALTDCTLERIDKPTMIRMVQEHTDISDMLLRYLLSRSIRHEEDLLDQLLNSSEKRLARILLLMARFGTDKDVEGVLPRINQEHLAQMVGTTRSRVSHFMNRFRKQGFIDYDSNGELMVRNSLLSVVIGALSKKAVSRAAARHFKASRSKLTLVAHPKPS